MARDNPSNPFTQDPNHTSKDVQMPVSKAKVMDVKGHPEQSAFHTVRIRVYGDESTFVAPVLTPVPGSVWIPPEGSDVAVIFTQNDKPFVIGSWYALDRVEDGSVDLPAYDPGDVRLGNYTGTHMTVENDGSITVETTGNRPINIDTHSATAKMSSNQTIAGGDQYHKLNFDAVDSADPNGLFDASDNAFTILAGGRHNISATVEFQTPGAQNRYTIALFKNGELFKRRNRQSVVNEELSLEVDTVRRVDRGDRIDVRIRQDSNADRVVNSDFEATEFSIQRHGI